MRATKTGEWYDSKQEGMEAQNMSKLTDTPSSTKRLIRITLKTTLLKHN